MFHNSIIITDNIHIVFLCYVVPARRIGLKLEYRLYVTKLSLMENGSLQAVVRILM
jgi:hypothetical protein